MAGHRSRHRGGPAGSDGARAERSGAGGGSGGGPPGGRGHGAAGGESEEDINGLVINVIRDRFQGIDMSVQEIDRAHRLPGPNNRVIVRFVRSGAGSVREQLMSRRMELRGRNDLFINESLTAQNSRIMRSLLDEKKNGKIYTVYTRWGYVYFKAEKYGASTRVESLHKAQQLGFTVKG